MRIIKQGIIPENIEHQATCPNCKCVFAFMASEAIEQKHQLEATYFKVACPCCSKPVYK